MRAPNTGKFSQRFLQQYRMHGMKLVASEHRGGGGYHDGTPSTGRHRTEYGKRVTPPRAELSGRYISDMSPMQA